jgi:hypothetical protein
VRPRVRTWASIAAAGLGGLTAIGAPAAAPPVDELAAPELACFDTPGPALGLELWLTQLDPALVQLGVTAHSAVVRELVQTCVAVDRRGVSRPAGVAAVVPSVDLACYRIDAAPLPEPATLVVAHQDPMLALLPGHAATLVQPVALCLPVARDGVALRPDERRLVQSIALECYTVAPGSHPAFGVGLTARDPRLAGAADRQLAIGAERGPICAPVAKNSERIPRDVLGVVRRIGVEQLAESRSAAAAAPAGAPETRVVLHHLNPLFATLPAVPVALHHASGVMVPVARRVPAP